MSLSSVVSSTGQEMSAAMPFASDIDGVFTVNKT